MYWISDSALDFIARHAGRLEPLVIEGDVLVTIINHSFQPLELQRLQLGTAHGFNFFLKKHSYTSETARRPLLRFSALHRLVGANVNKCIRLSYRKSSRNAIPVFSGKEKAAAPRKAPEKPAREGKSPGRT